MLSDGGDVKIFSGFVGKAYISGATVLDTPMTIDKEAEKKPKKSSASAATGKKNKKRKSRHTQVPPEIITLTGDRVLPIEKPSANRLITACIKELRSAYNDEFLSMKKRTVEDQLGEKVNFQVEKLVPPEVKQTAQLSDEKQNGWYALILTRGFCGMAIDAKGVPGLYLSVKNGQDAEPRQCQFQWSVYNAHRYMNQAIPAEKLQRYRTLIPRLDADTPLTWDQFKQEALSIAVERFQKDPIELPFADPKFLRRFSKLSEEEKEGFVARCEAAENQPKKRKRPTKKKTRKTNEKKKQDEKGKKTIRTPVSYSAGTLQGQYPAHAPGELERSHNVQQTFVRPFSSYLDISYGRTKTPSGAVHPDSFPLEDLTRLQGYSLSAMFMLNKTKASRHNVSLLEPSYALPGVFSMDASMDLSVTPGSHMVASATAHNDEVMKSSKCPWGTYFEAFISKTK